MNKTIQPITNVQTVLIPVSRNLYRWPIPLLLTALLFGEARNQDDVTKIAILWVVQNRVDRPCWWGWSHKSVVLKHVTKNGHTIYQFSCFNPRNVNYKKILNPLEYEKEDVWANCYLITQEFLKGRFLDPTYSNKLKKGATHYFDSSIKDNPPKWAAKLTFLTQIGDFYFYG